MIKKGLAIFKSLIPFSVSGYFLLFVIEEHKVDTYYDEWNA